jgi:uncharacterized protein
MSIDTAERAIDFFVKRTKDNQRVTVSFYGGEPLLNLELIKHCVQYIEARYFGKNISYGITSNGTLLDEEAIVFLADKGFNLLISIDGPEEIHDIHRRFASSGEGSFSTIMDNVAAIKKLRPEYYHEKVRFNAVSDAKQPFCRINEFVTDEELFGKDKFALNYISSQYTEKKMPVSEEFYTEREYEFFKFLLAKLREISRDKTASLLSARFNEMYLRCFQNIGIEEAHISTKSHHAGPCLPGVLRLFVDTDGRFFPCERVSEFSETVRLGSIDEGVSVEKAANILNMEKATSARCRNCWAYRQCIVCVAMADDLQEVSDAETQKRCPFVRNSIEAIFKDFCILRELGYTFDDERIRSL